jgi:TRAP-type uncharacterized transport system substrate-binding protein
MAFINQALVREYFWIAAPVTLVIAAAFWASYQFVEPAPPRTFVMSTGAETGAYHAFGKRYAAELKKSGVTLRLKPSAGSTENLASVNDPASGVSVTFVQGGIALGEKKPGLVSLGRLFLEPLWVFHRLPEEADRLYQLRGRRIAIGPEGSGTRPLALSMLAINEISGASATLLPIGGSDAVKALEMGEIDAAFLVMSPESAVIQQLLRNPAIKLMNFAQAEAYTRVLPYLNRITLPHGVVDMVKDIPASDIAMVAPATALVASERLHPALIGLLVEAAKEIHSVGGLFQRIGDYPKAIDPEFEMSDDASRFYKNGPPFLQRFLPFWLANFLERMSVLVVPFATLMLPLIKIGPIIYKWSIKRRIFFWYDRLKKLEDQVRMDVTGVKREAHTAEIHEIEEAVGTIPVPLSHADQFYSLRAAIDLVRQRLTTRLPAPATANA